MNRTNQSIVEEVGVISGTPMNLTKHTFLSTKKCRNLYCKDTWKATETQEDGNDLERIIWKTG